MLFLSHEDCQHFEFFLCLLCPMKNELESFPHGWVVNALSKYWYRGECTCTITTWTILVINSIFKNTIIDGLFCQLNKP